MRRLVVCLVLCLAAVGCGGGSEVSPVVEYHAALEALKDRDKMLAETIAILKSGDLKPEERSKFESNKRNLEETIRRLEERARAAKARL